jgi:hypothetical protein
MHARGPSTLAEPTAVGAPMVVLAAVVAGTLSGTARDAMLAAAPDLAWAAMQFVRPVLIPAVYWLYRDLQKSEENRSEQERPIPAVLRVVLALTRPLPKPGSWD